MKDQNLRKRLLGKMIRSIRKGRNLSLRQLAAAADMEHSHINLIEKGEVSPSAVTLEMLAEALNVSPCAFFKADTVSKNPIVLNVIERVKTLRKDAKISAEELSIRLGLPEKEVTEIENLESPFQYTIDQLNEIARILSCSPRSFLPEEPI